MPDPASTKQTTADLVAELRDPLKVLRNSEKAAIASALERLDSANLLLVADRDDWLQKAKVAREDEIVRRANASRSEFIPADELLSALESATRDTSPAPATVTDEPADERAAMWWRLGAKWARASVGPALARLAELEKMEQRAKDARTDMKSRQNATNASEEGVQVALYAECVLNHILTGSDAEKGKT